MCGQIPTGTGGIAYGVQLINVHRIGTGLTFGYAGNHVTAVVKTAFRQAYRVAVGRGDVDTVAANGGAVTGGVHKLGAGQIGQLFGQLDVQRIGTVGDHTNVVVRQFTGGTASQVHLAAQLTVKVTGGVVATESQRLVNRSIQRTQRIADIVVSGGIAVSRIA